MPGKNKEKKSKLRTASEVLSRLKWPSDEDFATLDNTIIGYDCRINGPMEKYAADFSSIDQGGDIPEHRIQYFRIKSLPLNEGIYWDRKGRIDRLFGSGSAAGSGDPDQSISAITLDSAAEAIVTMQRLAEERAMRAEEKAKLRARKHMKKAALARKLIETSNKNSTLASDGNNKNLSLVRHVWEEVENYHVYDTETLAWKVQPTTRIGKGKPKECKKSLKVITWNILFDLSRDKNKQFVQVDSSLLTDTDSVLNRWRNTLKILCSEEASIIALQEITPRFVELLEAQDWVKEKYALSSGLHDLSCIEPYGNLTMWKKDSFTPSNLFLCKDLNRCRSMVVSLQFTNNQILNVANVHLPADNHNSVTMETNDRTTARQRELSAIIAKLQILEGNQITPIILGDFNSDSELLSKEYFDDSWILSGVENPGLTYDWKTNKRAEKLRASGFSKKEPRRIDRVYIGKSKTKITHAKLIGDITNSSEFPPSDHFGISITLRIEEKKGNLTTMYDPNNVECNAWSKSAIPSTQTLLALIFNHSTCTNNIPLYDKKSSLPVPHVTLLNGFVDFLSEERLKLSSQVVQDAIRQSVYPDTSSSLDLSLLINRNSLRIFEHRSSATLVCCPDVESESGQWLKRLYNTLRVKFPLCHEQESRFATGWTPHFSIGSFSNVSQAREHMENLISDDSWDGNTSAINVVGLGLFQRDTEDGQFYLTQSIPFVRHHCVDTNLFLSDAGAYLSGSMSDISSLVLKEVERACQYVAIDIGQNRLQTSVKPYGSYSIAASLPGISDIDAILILQSCLPSCDSFLRSQDSNSFLNSIAARISCLHKNAKTRIRVSTEGNRELNILTIKLAPQYPFLDLMICRVDSCEEPVDSISVGVLNTIKDNDAIMSAIYSLKKIAPFNKIEVISGALRIIKLWAYNRQIYGTKFGFLGGGGWLILLLWFVQCDQLDLSNISNESTIAGASSQLAKLFFQDILSKWSNTDVIRLRHFDRNEVVVIKEASDLVTSRNSMAVIAPESGGNFGKSSTKSTYLTTAREILRAKQLLGEKSSDFNLILETFTMYGLFLALSIKIPSGTHTTKPADIKALGAAHILNMIISLEHKIGPSVIRPISNATKKEGSFWFFIGVEESSAATLSILNEFVHEKSLQMEEERRAFMSDTEFKLSCLNNEEYERIIA